MIIIFGKYCFHFILSKHILIFSFVRLAHVILDFGTVCHFYFQTSVSFCFYHGSYVPPLFLFPWWLNFSYEEMPKTTYICRICIEWQCAQLFSLDEITIQNCKCTYFQWKLHILSPFIMGLIGKILVLG